MKRLNLKRGLFVTAILAVFITCNLQAQDLKSAVLLTKSEQYDKAGTMLQELIQKEPSNSKYYFFLGENYLLEYFADTISNSLADFTTRAKDIFQKGVNANQADPLNYVGLAKVASYLGDKKTADEMRAKAKSYLLPYKNIKKMVPPAKDYAFALAKIAESYIIDGEVDTAAALPLIRQAIKIDKTNAEIFLIAGDIYITANDGSNAIKNYNLAEFADPKSPTAQLKIGNIYVRGKNLQVAIPYYENAIAIDANFAPAYRELGQLYWLAQRLEQSKENYKKYIDLSAGNIPAKTRYINSLFYAGDYDEVIKNVEEVLAVDKTRGYMNRLAAYAYYEKKNPDYSKALTYMDELFRTVPADRILWKDYHYLARIIMKKNQNYPKLLDELENQQALLDKENARYASASAANKPKLKPSLDQLTAKVEGLKAEIKKADSELDEGFKAYDNVLGYKPMDKGVLNEMYGYYYNYKRYNQAARTVAKLIDPAKNDPEAYMKVGRTFYTAGNYKSADSVFTIVTTKFPDYIPGYLFTARTYSRQDPDYKFGLARPKFEKLLSVASKDSVKNEEEMSEGLEYLGYFYLEKGEFSSARDYYNRLINLDPNNKETRIKGYNGLGLIELRQINNEKTNEGKLAILGRAGDAYNKILAIDPANASAKAQLSWVREYEAAVRKGINPNEIKGTVKNAAGGAPIPYASVRVKDTAAEAMTNTKGEFKFEIPQGMETLVISAKGYQTKEVPITKSRVYAITLEK